MTQGIRQDIARVVPRKKRRRQKADGPGGYLVKDFADGWYWTPNAALDHAGGAPVWSVADGRYETEPPAPASDELLEALEEVMNELDFENKESPFFSSNHYDTVRAFIAKHKGPQS